MVDAERVRGELRSLVGDPRPLSADKLVGTPYLTEVLGAGDIDVAANLLKFIANQSQADPDVRAAFTMIGFRTPGSVQARLQKIADEHYIDTRTARRWAERGFTTIAGSLPTVSLTDGPKVALQAHVSHGVVSYRLDYTLPTYTDVKPVLHLAYMDGDLQEHPAQAYLGTVRGRHKWNMVDERRRPLEDRENSDVVFAISYSVISALPPNFSFITGGIELPCYSDFWSSLYFARFTVRRREPRTDASPASPSPS